MSCKIYVIKNTINSMVYVGQTWQSLQQRFKTHKNIRYKGCIKLHNALNKYGRDKFVIELLTTCEDQATADKMESFWIEQYNSISEGYNLREGGANGKFSSEARIKMSSAHEGKKLSCNHIEQIKLSLVGRPSPMKGKKISEETKIKMSQAKLGRKRGPMSEAQKQKLSLANLGKKRVNI